MTRGTPRSAPTPAIQRQLECLLCLKKKIALRRKAPFRLCILAQNICAVRHSENFTIQQIQGILQLRRFTSYISYIWLLVISMG